MDSNTISDAVTMPGGAEGALLANRYRIVRQLGQGGMGSVWLAEDTQLDNKPFAIKMLPSILVSNKRAYRQLKDEALVAMKLTHPNIVTLRAFEENNGNPFLVMDYIDGQTLDDYLSEKGTLAEDETIKILHPIAAALDYAHSKGVVHRDVKPGNVMIAKDGTPYILDFGIAREIQETMTRVTGKLSSGTLLYMSPEQLHGAAPKKEQDVYSFAAMAYECLAGAPPFNRGQIEYRIDNDTPEPLQGRVTSNTPLAAGIMAGLAKKPEGRPQTCVAVLKGDSPMRRSGVAKNARVKNTTPENARIVRSPKGISQFLAVLGLLVALVAVSYYGWTKYGIGSQENQIEKPASSEPKPPAVEEADIIEIRVQAAKCENAMGRISDEDGFASKKASLSDDLAAARAYDNSRSWVEAAAAYTNYVNSFKALAQINKDRIGARSKCDAACEARLAASDANSSQYAPSLWDEAERLFNAAEAAWSGMDFHSSAKKYDFAAKQYGLAKDDAVKERDRQEEEQREKEREDLVERERRKNWPIEGREFTINHCSLGMTMKWCPAGTFTMGSPESEEGRYDIETQHRVTLTRGFWLGETEVTQGQWKKLMNGETVVDLARKGIQDDNEYMVAGKRQTVRASLNMTKFDNPANICGDVNDMIPVYWISWNDAVDFCRRLTKKERDNGRIPDGYEYRLPTEAEWEYACRADENASLPNGKTLIILGENNAPALDEIAWYGGNSSQNFLGKGCNTFDWEDKQYPGGYASVREVKGKCPNKWGLYDMLGNVWEWCGDNPENYSIESVTDPYSTTTDAFRVFRGGSWRSSANRCRPAFRNRREQSGRGGDLGFRVALAPILSKYVGDERVNVEALAADNVQTNLVCESVHQTVRQQTTMENSSPKTGDTKFLTMPGGQTMEMIYVEPDSFMMGSPISEKGRSLDEVQHKVTLTKGFWLGKYEVTQRQWQSVMGSNPSKWRGKDLPVENISWEDCQEFITKVNAMLCCGARLPTEAEWEYACRSKTDSAYAGFSIDDMGWYGDNSDKRTHPVGQKMSNAWGFCDMHGNVWEWCNDWYGDYQSVAITDPQGATSGIHRVLRGGSALYFARYCRSAYRRDRSPDDRYYNYGFRLCCSEIPPQ